MTVMDHVCEKIVKFMLPRTWRLVALRGALLIIVSVDRGGTRASRPCLVDPLRSPR